MHRLTLSPTVFFWLLAYSQELQIGFPEPRISLNEMYRGRKAFKTSSPSRADLRTGL